MTDFERISSSFRDPSGFLFTSKGVLYRAVGVSYKENYDAFISSRLYSDLAAQGLIIPHEEVAIPELPLDSIYKFIKPEKIEFISYPYEWCFSQLKDAALTTLRIEKIALEHGMTLKDATAYNIQFCKGKPVLIDSLSFEKYKEGMIWPAYRQFCQHFLAPLALMSKKDVRLIKLLQNYIDGVPLDLASSLLPFSSYFHFSILIHIHMHSKSQTYFADKQAKPVSCSMNKQSFTALIENLESAVKSLEWRFKKTEWAEYYKETNYSESSFEEKKKFVENIIQTEKPRYVWDLGANTGVFSRIAAKQSALVLSIDSDPAAVEKNYLVCTQNKESNILPLIMDVTNPSPSIGWDNNERISIKERGRADCVIALALIHHLAISNNVPFEYIAEYFSSISDSLIIEFIGKDDSNVKRLLSTREDIFTGYSKQNFERVFLKSYKIVSAQPIPGTERVIYFMKK